MKFLDPLDLTGLEIRNVCLQALAGPPGGPGLGRVYFDSMTGKARYWDGAAWQDFGGAAGVTSFSAGNLAPLFTTGVATATTTPALSFTLSNAAANAVFAGPAAGGAAAPTFRALVAADLPALTAALITDFATAVHAILDPAVQGLNQKPTARVATAAALPANTYANGASGVGATLTANANGALAVDGVAVAAGDVVLVRSEAAASHNGLYVVTQAGGAGTPYILTRHADMDTSAEFPGAFVPVDQGTANGNSLWLADATGAVVVGTTAITFTQLNRGTDLSAGTGIAIAGNVVSIDPAYTGQASIVTLGTVTVGTWNATPIDVAHGGTGATTAAAARANLGTIGKFSALIGDGATTAIAVAQGTHGLAVNGQMLAACYDATTGAQVQSDVTIDNGTGTVTFTFAVAPAANAYRVVIVG